jgi:hypothetical protein
MGPAGPAGSAQPLDTTLELSEDMPGVNCTIIDISGGAGSPFQVGDTLSITFTLEMDNGTPIPLNELDSARMWMAGPTTLYQKVTGNYSDIATGSVQNADGSWTYTLSDPIPATYPLQYYRLSFPEPTRCVSGPTSTTGIPTARDLGMWEMWSRTSSWARQPFWSPGPS